MTDRELLEKAARAAGIVGSWEIDSSSVQGREYFNVPYDNHNMLSGFEWNPLREDGDALRLAVKLYLWEAVRLAHREVSADVDIYAATRRAIVRAAAAIADSTDAKE
jgi:hypothetical protein